MLKCGEGGSRWLRLARRARELSLGSCLEGLYLPAKGFEEVATQNIRPERKA